MTLSRRPDDSLTPPSLRRTGLMHRSMTDALTAKRRKERSRPLDPHTNPAPTAAAACAYHVREPVRCVSRRCFMLKATASLRRFECSHAAHGATSDGSALHRASGIRTKENEARNPLCGKCDSFVGTHGNSRCIRPAIAIHPLNNAHLARLNPSYSYGLCPCVNRAPGVGVSPLCPGNGRRARHGNSRSRRQLQI
jgi:hypothetical protein